MSRRITSSLIIMLLISLSFPAVAVSKSLAARTAPASLVLDKSDSAKQSAFHDAMRKLWGDHITWTRLFIVEAIGDLPDKGATTERLLQNQVDIGNAINPITEMQRGETDLALENTHYHCRRTGYCRQSE